MSGELVLVTGQSRSGKTYWTGQQIKKARAVLVWDCMGEFAADYRCKPIDAKQLAHIAARGLPGRFAFDAPVTPEAFDFFCRMAWVWIRAAAKKRRTVCLVVEELADVTSPGKAPRAWGQIVRKGLRFNPKIYALTQRPAESDKTIFGNATRLHCHAMARADDRRAMARELDIPQTCIDSLDLSQYQWIERDHRKRRLLSGGKGKKPRIPAH